jgi:hypothetical protein
VLGFNETYRTYLIFIQKKEKIIKVETGSTLLIDMYVGPLLLVHQAQGCFKKAGDLIAYHLRIRGSK